MKQEPKAEPGSQALESSEINIGGNAIKIQELGEVLATLSASQLLQIFHTVVSKGGGDGLKLLIDGVEIQSTPSNFEDNDKVTQLEVTAKKYPFSRWLEEMGKLPSQATREALCKWWETFMTMAGENGFQAGQIDSISGGIGNLWKATGPLATKMLTYPARYKFLPALLANHSQEVARILSELDDPEAFLELLTGETMEQLRKSETFLGAFSTVKEKDGKPEDVSRTIKDAIYSVALALQRR